MIRFSLLLAFSLLAAPSPAAEPVRLIFDTDIGNDVDDALALALIHEFVDRGEAELLAVTISKDNPWAAACVDAINTFYGRPDIPIGVVRGGKTPPDGKFNRVVAEKRVGGELAFPHDLRSGADAPEAVSVLRQVLAAQPDGSVALVSVGFLTNMACLLESEPDDASPLTGAALIEKKISLYCTMAGAFSQPRAPEYNARVDAEATRLTLEKWPTPIVMSGFEIGMAVLYPAESIENDFGYVDHHPVAEAYRAYLKMPYDRPTWDLTAVLHAVRPERNYFGLSYPGEIRMNEHDVTEFTERRGGHHRYLTLTPEQVIRVRELLVEMVSSPPKR